MHGIPVAVKDQMYTRGIRTTIGSPIFGDFVPDEDATVIARLKDAGAILPGKLNATEFCTTGFSHAFKTARNPWDLQRYNGGSSSGSGAATAAGLCATSLGEDTVGSIRFPAAWCGLVGLKPTWSRVSRYGLKPGLFSMDTLGPISRTVEDCAMTLQAIAGHDPRDSFSSKAPVPDYRAALKEDLRGVRVGLVKEDMSSEVVAPEVRDAALKAAEVLRQLGASVDEVSTPLADDAWTIYLGIRIESAMNYHELVRDRLQEIRHDNRIAYLVGSVLPAQAFYKAQKLRTLLGQQVLETMEHVDILIDPTAGVVAQKIVEGDLVIDSREKFNRVSVLFTATSSLVGTPALSICCGFNNESLPIGLQIAGRPFDEETVLRTAYAYEQATEWHQRWPSI